MSKKIDYDPSPEKIPQGMSAPRLQLRWATEAPDHPNDLVCYYELVIPLREHDIRNEAGKGFGVIQLGATMSNGSGRHWGKVEHEAPFRDGAHAQWDAALLGNLPIYVISPDGNFAPMHRPQKG